MTRSVDVARAEASAIDGAFRGGPIDGRPLRLHTVGDCRNRTAARIVGGAVVGRATTAHRDPLDERRQIPVLVSSLFILKPPP